jgi:large subunit ribosomal protein L17
MRHRKYGRKLNRSGAHRNALKRNMAISIFEHGSIHTTPQKAKFAQPFVERLVTLAKHALSLSQGDDSAKIKALNHRRKAIALLYDALVEDPDHKGYKKGIVSKLFENIAPKYSNRNGGYTRIIMLPQVRLGDNAQQCIFELVEGEDVDTSSTEIKKGIQKKALRLQQNKPKAKIKKASEPKESKAEAKE